MNIFDMLCKINLIPNLMFPETPLPNPLFTFAVKKNVAPFACDLSACIDDVDRQTHLAPLVDDGTFDGLANPPVCVGGKAKTAAMVEAVHGFHQADVTLLNEVDKRNATMMVVSCDADDETQVGSDEVVPCPSRPTVRSFQLGEVGVRNAKSLVSIENLAAPHFSPDSFDHLVKELLVEVSAAEF